MFRLPRPFSNFDKGFTMTAHWAALRGLKANGGDRIARNKHGWEDSSAGALLPKNILNYGIGGNLDVAGNALASTANFLKAHGWRAGAGYQPGEANFLAIQAWNAAPVYQRAIAVIGQQIDGGGGTSARR
jgi:hypothetical protein